MKTEEIDLLVLTCRILVALIVFVGTTMGLYSRMVQQFARKPLSLPAHAVLQSRPWPEACVVPVMAVTLLFSALAAMQHGKPAAAPSALAMLQGAAVYSLALLATVFVCIAYAKKDVRELFFSPTCSSKEALLKGLRYGLEILPLILLISIGTSLVGEELGFDMKAQDIFDCLGDARVPPWVRGVLLFFAVGVAPVVEELLFRGVLFPIVLKGRRFLFAAILTSFYFALIHLHGPSFPSLMVLSIGFSAGYASTGSILTPMAMHAVFNLTGTLLFFSGVNG